MQSVNWPSTDNYFRFYGLTPSFEIDTAELRRLFLEKSRQFHPDYFEDDHALQGKAIEVTAFNNKAFKALNSPTERLKYLIQINISETENSQKLPQDFLMEMLDLNEQIDEFAFADDKAALKANIEAELNGNIENLMRDLIALVNAENWTEAKSELLKLNYLERLSARLIAPL
jgi:molecular chaperone HscB